MLEDFGGAGVGVGGVGGEIGGDIGEGGVNAVLSFEELYSAQFSFGDGDGVAGGVPVVFIVWFKLFEGGEGVFC